MNSAVPALVYPTLRAAFPAAARAGLDQHRRTDARRFRAQALGALVVAVVAGHHRHAERAHAALGVDLRAHRGDRVGGRADEHEPAVDDQPRERRALAEEAVTRMDRVGAERLRRGDDLLAVEIRLGGRTGPDANRGVHRFAEQRALVGVRIHADRRDAQLARAARDADGDLAAVGDQQRADHRTAHAAVRRSRNARSPSWPSSLVRCFAIARAVIARDSSYDAARTAGIRALAAATADGPALSTAASASRTLSSSPSSSAPRIQFTSAPPQNVLPSPASTTTRTDASSPSSENVSRSRAISSALKALRTPGRASTTRARAPSRSTRRTGSDTGSVVRRGVRRGPSEAETTVRRRPLAAALTAAFLAVPLAPSRAQSPAPAASGAAAPAAHTAGVTRATLANGLQVVVLRDTLAPVVSTWMNYLAGSDEEPITGIAHAQEHMLFRGSKTLTASQFADTTAITGGTFNADTQ